VEHLVTALVFSARDLLPVGGSLAIDTRRVELSDAASADGVLGHFVLSVSATGYGVQPAKASSALELVVQRCGAELFFDGSTDRGSVFEVRFPLARPDAHHVAPV